MCCSCIVVVVMLCCSFVLLSLLLLLQLWCYCVACTSVINWPKYNGEPLQVIALPQMGNSKSDIARVNMEKATASAELDCSYPLSRSLYLFNLSNLSTVSFFRLEYFITTFLAPKKTTKAVNVVPMYFENWCCQSRNII